MLFISSEKLFSFLRYLNFCDDLARLVKRLVEKTTVNSKIYDVTAWLTNNYNTPITQYLEQ